MSDHGMPCRMNRHTAFLLRQNAVAICHMNSKRDEYTTGLNVTSVKQQIGSESYCMTTALRLWPMGKSGVPLYNSTVVLARSAHSPDVPTCQSPVDLCYS